MTPTGIIVLEGAPTCRYSGRLPARHAHMPARGSMGGSIFGRSVRIPTSDELVTKLIRTSARGCQRQFGTLLDGLCEFYLVEPGAER